MMVTMKMFQYPTAAPYRNQLDRDLVKRIVLVSAAAIVVVILSIALMQLL